MTDTQAVGFNRVAQKLRFGITPSDTRGVIFDRSFAYVIDFIILVILGLVAGFIAFVLTILSFGILSPLLALLSFIPLVYHTYFLSQQGATPGMNAMGVKMITMDGKPVTLVHAFLTTVIFYLTVPATSFLILLVAFFNDEKRTLHDILTHTVVVNDEIPNETIDNILK
ncbi:RDD family protein [Kiloniella litopenaei]|uniref:RDD family protein n=1 Tax=Kiloniella litopenaei TaxID=1549748 RepID=UPI000698523A|nr:RDD family protein [Kiloniella litopenaei]